MSEGELDVYQQCFNKEISYMGGGAGAWRRHPHSLSTSLPRGRRIWLPRFNCGSRGRVPRLWVEGRWLGVGRGRGVGRGGGRGGGGWGRGGGGRGGGGGGGGRGEYRRWGEFFFDWGDGTISVRRFF